MNRKWFFSVDRGGTFTDVIGQDLQGTTHTLKILSKSDQYEDSSLEGKRRLLGLETKDPITSDKVAKIRMGTTVTTNALLERDGARLHLL